MKVHELIELLKQKDQNAMVVIPGYEGGLDEVTNVGTTHLALNVNSGGYDGEHEASEDQSLPVGCCLT